MKPSATIIGGSMAGLFAATALLKKGWDISIHEKVPVPLSGRGAGIATYDELADLVFKATNNNNVLGTTAKSRVSLDINGKIINSYDYPQVYTSWQYLFSILREQISNDDYFMGDDCIRIEQNEGKAIAFFKNGKKKETDLIIIANGIKSELRTYVDNKAYPQYAGYVGWRGVVNEEEISKNSLETLSNYFIVVLPYNQQIASYPIAGEGKNPFKIGERRINWIWYKPVPQKKLKEIFLGKSGQQFDDGIPPNEIREEIVYDLFKEAEEKLPPQLVELVKITKQPLIQPIFDLQSMKMKNGRVVTIGDAAFTARPHVGMGVTKAAMDAFTLSEYLEYSYNLDDLDKWEHSRLKESQFIVKRSRKLGQYLSIPKNNEDLIMPNVQNVLKDTAISLYDMEDYKI